MNSTAIDAIFAALFVLGLAGLWYFFWKPYLVDSLRSKLFAIRHRMLIRWLDAGHSPEEKVFLEVWRYINAMIAGAHRMHLSDVLAAHYILKKAGVRGYAARRFEELYQELQNLEESDRQILIDAISESERELRRFFAYFNPILIPWYLRRKTREQSLSLEQVRHPSRLRDAVETIEFEEEHLSTLALA